MSLLGWKLLNNYGNYGAYGWKLGLWHWKHSVTHSEWDVENDWVIQIGPFKAMIRKVTKQGVTV